MYTMQLLQDQRTLLSTAPRQGSPVARVLPLISLSCFELVCTAFQILCLQVLETCGCSCLQICQDLQPPRSSTSRLSCLQVSRLFCIQAFLHPCSPASRLSRIPSLQALQDPQPSGSPASRLSSLQALQPPGSPASRLFASQVVLQ